MAKTKECPHCYSIIDVRASVCPVCSRDIETVNRTSQKKKRGGCLWQWFIPMFIIGLLVVCGFIYLAGEDGNNDSQNTPTRSLPATFTPAARSTQKISSQSSGSIENSLEFEIKAALKNYDYDQQQVIVEKVEISGTELVVHLRRRGEPSYNDYFGQLGTIHGVVAELEPNASAVRTTDVEGLNGFVVQMDDLLDYYHGRLNFDEYRNRWGFFEP